MKKRNMLAVVLFAATAVMTPAASAYWGDTSPYVVTVCPEKTLGIYASAAAQEKEMNHLVELIKNPQQWYRLKTTPKYHPIGLLGYGIVLDLTNITIKLKHEWMEVISKIPDLKELRVNFASLEEKYKDITWPTSLKLCVKINTFDVAKHIVKYTMTNANHLSYDKFPSSMQIVENMPSDESCCVIGFVVGCAIATLGVATVCFGSELVANHFFPAMMSTMACWWKSVNPLYIDPLGMCQATAA